MVAVPVVLGWANPDTGPEQLRLYALDAGPSPRWATPHARVVETALQQTTGAGEGCRGVVVIVEDRTVSADVLARIVAAAGAAVAAVLAEARR